MTNPARPGPLDLQDIATRNRNARHIVTGFSRSLPTLAEVWRYLSAALADTSRLVAEVVRLRADLAAARLDRANLLAAIRAALAADRDGETDPLGYLRDELADRATGPGRRG
ncbi:MAG TPA: hypothetical protein VHY31_04890 [Streptosporangiaceae bacterium]|nr:hypothetical protein [Streptosporangiaceae bacterium]